MPSDLPRYRRDQSYAWNYDHAPTVLPMHPVAAVPGEWSFCGRRVPSPLGVAAGPLLNGKWLLYYAALGFDVLTYKTVRSAGRESYPWPNLQPVRTEQVPAGSGSLPADDVMRGTWAVSFGMPSQPPDVWRRDLEWTRRELPAEKILVVSVVGTTQPGWTLDDLAADYAQCARWAVESGADAVELNFSCPNVATRDGQLYQQPADAAVVARAVRGAVGKSPVVVKVGSVADDAAAGELLATLAPHVDALAMTNSVSTTVHDAAGKLLFDGARRGICGAAIRETSVAQVDRFRRAGRQTDVARPLIGVGGAVTAADVRQYLAAGASSVHLATAIMTDPAVALAIRADLAGQGT